MSAIEPARERRVDPVSTGLLVLRAYLAVVFLDAGVSKFADRRFLEAGPGSSPVSMQATIRAVRHLSPIGGLLGPVGDHPMPFGILMGLAEVAVGVGLATGLLIRVAAAGGMLLSLILWLTVSWQASPWFTSADLVYLVALVPMLLAGPRLPFTVDGWLGAVGLRRPDPREARTRRTLLVGAGAVAAAVLVAGGSVFRRSPSSATGSGGTGPSGSPVPSGSASAGHAILDAATVPVGGAAQAVDPVTGDPVWVLQLTGGRYTCLDAVCPHQGCPVTFVSASAGFSCPCHGSQFTATGAVTRGPASRALSALPVRLQGGSIVRS